MEFKTHNDIDIDIMGTSLMGYIDCSYDRLLKTFGAPHTGDGYKVDAQWLIQFEDNRTASIYNFKDGKNYMGNKGKALDNIRDWHIGGHNKSVIEDVKEILNNSALRFLNLEKHKDIVNAPTQDEWDTMSYCIEQYRDRLQKKSEDDPDRYITIILDEALDVIPSNVIDAFK